MVNLCHPWLPLRLCMPSVTCWGVLVWNYCDPHLTNSHEPTFVQQFSRMHFPTRQQLPICWILIKVTGRNFTTRTHGTSNAAQCPGHTLLGSDFFWHSKGWGIWAISFRHFGWDFDGFCTHRQLDDNFYSFGNRNKLKKYEQVDPGSFNLSMNRPFLESLENKLTATASVKVFHKCKKDFRNLRTESLFSLPFEYCITIFLKSWPL